MKKTMMTALVALAMGMATAHANDAAKNDVTKAELTVTKSGSYEAGPAEYFTGDVSVGSYFTSGEYDNYKGAIVNFSPGARTAWHTHPQGQTLVVTQGEGRAQQEGKPVQKILPGDTVWIPAGVRHWHGAAPESAMTHIAIQSPDDTGNVVTWMEKVTDQAYNGKEQ